MKPPRFLLGAGLVFWGWQTGFLAIGVTLAVLLEAVHLVSTRLEFSDDDFTRIWTFCTLLVIVSAFYSFSTNGGPESFRGLFNDPNFRTQASAGHSSARTAVMLLRSLPMTLFPFVLAQVYSTREGISLTMVSLILRRRWNRAKRRGQPLPAPRLTHLGYPYLAICLFAASAHGGQDITFFWGTGILLIWALWPRRSPRFRWYTCLAWTIVGTAAGFGGQRGIIQLERFLEGYNPQWLSVAARRGSDPQQSQTDIGESSRLKLSARIVVRLETPDHHPPPTYLREASYRRYRSPIWSTGATREAFQTVTPDPEMGTSWDLQPGVRKAAAVNLACYLAPKGSLLPLPSGVSRLDNLAAFTLQNNSEGAVLANGPGLVIFDAHYGPGQTMDSPGTADDLEVPPKEMAALEEVIDELHLRDTDPAHPEAALRTIEQYFQRKFRYALGGAEGKKAAPAEETPLTRFLLRTHSGHCEYFATATVLLLRELKIPARYAVGFSVHEGAGSHYVVRQHDGHAWCLVWHEQGKYWEDYDTTPTSWMETDAPPTGWFQWLGDGWSRLVFEISRLRWGQSNLRQYLLWLLIPALGLLAFQIFYRGGIRRRRQPKSVAVPPPVWPGLDSEFFELARRLAAGGFPRLPGESAHAWLRRVGGNPILANRGIQWSELIRLHYQYRFDPRGLTPPDRQRLSEENRKCLAQLGDFAEN